MERMTVSKRGPDFALDDKNDETKVLALFIFNEQKDIMN